jgi:formate dehydrogenase subunit delta
MENAILIRMANQITTYFAVYPNAEAHDGIAKHIHNTWDPRMRNAMKGIIDSGGEGLKPLFIAAMDYYFQGPKSAGKRSTVDPRKQAPHGAEPSFADGGGDAG